MKILHTSDWHIGQRLFNKSRDEEHHAFFTWLIELINRENVELLLVSGDIFDLGYPSNQALQLYYQTLNRLSASSCKNIVITGGNHDSVSTLNAPKEILQFLNIHVVGGVSDKIDDEIIEIRGHDNQLRTVVCAVPFLRDKDIRMAVAGESFDNRIKATREGIVDHYKQVARVVEPYKNQGLPIIAMGHLFATGASTSDSEREIHIGNLGDVNITQFPDLFDYMALGHIHRQQVINGDPRVRYSGAPLALSFGERNDTKSVVLLEIKENKLATIQPVQIPVFRRLYSFSGSYSEVVNRITNHQTDSVLKDWADVEISEEQYNPDMIADFEKVMDANSQIEILKYKIRFADHLNGSTDMFNQAVTLSDLSAKEVFDQLLEKQNITEKDEYRESFALLINDL